MLPLTLCAPQSLRMPSDSVSSTTLSPASMVGPRGISRLPDKLSTSPGRVSEPQGDVSLRTKSYLGMHEVDPLHRGSRIRLGNAGSFRMSSQSSLDLDDSRHSIGRMTSIDTLRQTQPGFVAPQTRLSSDAPLVRESSSKGPKPLHAIHGSILRMSTNKDPSRSASNATGSSSWGGHARRLNDLDLSWGARLPAFPISFRRYPSSSARHVDGASSSQRFLGQSLAPLHTLCPPMLCPLKSAPPSERSDKLPTIAGKIQNLQQKLASYGPSVSASSVAKAGQSTTQLSAIRATSLDQLYSASVCLQPMLIEKVEVPPPPTRRRTHTKSSESA